jgi:biopolymer transport protein ExbD
MYFRREEEENVTLELTPLIDVVFLLLIFFMVSTAFVDFPRQMDISLPASKTAVADETPQNLEIEMTAQKEIYLNGEKLTLQALEKKVAEFKNPRKRNALIRADKNIPYGQVIRVMGILQGAKILDISVAVK